MLKNNNEKVKLFINLLCWTSGNIVLVSRTYQSRIDHVSIPYRSRINPVSFSYRSPIILLSFSLPEAETIRKQYGNNTKPIYLGREDGTRMRLSGYLEVGLLRSKA